MDQRFSQSSCHQPRKCWSPINYEAIWGTRGDGNSRGGREKGREEEEEEEEEEEKRKKKKEREKKKERKEKKEKKRKRKKRASMPTLSLIISMKTFTSMLARWWVKKVKENGRSAVIVFCFFFSSSSSLDAFQLNSSLRHSRDSERRRVIKGLRVNKRRNERAENLS